MVNYTQCSYKGGGVTLDEGTQVVDDTVVVFSLDYREDLVWKLHGNLVHGECHSFDVKGSDIGALGCVIY